MLSLVISMLYTRYRKGILYFILVHFISVLHSVWTMFFFLFLFFLLSTDLIHNMFQFFIIVVSEMEDIFVFSELVEGRFKS